MLSAIRNFFENRVGADPQAGNEHGLRLATAALLVEMSRQDDAITADERLAVRAAVREKFALSESEAEELLRLAEAEVTDATDYYQFTSLINRDFSHEQKMRVVELMWRIAGADGSVHRYEEHLVRRVADLLHLSHREFITAKHRALGS